MFTKEDIFNLALGALLLTRRITDSTTDTSNENNVLNTHWDMAWRSTLEDLDLDGNSSQLVLALITEDPEERPEWKYVYRYPASCTILRRIKSMALKDNRESRIPLKTGMRNGVKCIFTNEMDAIIECIENTLSPTMLTANAALAVAYKLAMLSSPLITGKGADKLRKEIQGAYVLAKSEAQEHDMRENTNYDEDHITSEFVNHRLS